VIAGIGVFIVRRHTGNRDGTDHWAAVGAVAGLIGALIAVPSAVQAVRELRQPALRPTDLQTLEPWHSPGALESARQALSAPLAAQCQAFSRARYGPSTHRCLTDGGVVFDPCYDPPPGSWSEDVKVVACVTAPWDPPDFVRVDHQEDPDDAPPAQEEGQSLATLWAFALANNDRCLRYPEGTQAYIGSRPIVFICDRGDVVDIDEGSPSWSAEYFAHGNAASKRLTLAIAWF
jgi:hypothetical protein